jgi:hypothetical protein
VNRFFEFEMFEPDYMRRPGRHIELRALILSMWFDSADGLAFGMRLGVRHLGIGWSFEWEAGQ